MALWAKATPAPAREVRIAAASLASTGPKPTEAIAPLLDCRAHPANDRAATACAVALLTVYDKLDKLDDDGLRSARSSSSYSPSRSALS